MAEAPYARVYWSVRDDPKFATVYDDDRLLATWLRLLIEADGMYPAPAAIPRSASRTAFRQLVQVGLVDTVGANLYRIHGLASERSRRSAAASNAATAKWSARNAGASSGRNAGASSEVMLAKPSRAEHSQAEQSIAHANGEDDAAVAFNERTGEFPGAKMLSWINDLAETHGEGRVAATIRSTAMTGRNTGEYLRAVRDKLRAEDHAAEKAEAAGEKARLAEKRAPLPDNPVTAMIREAIHAKYGEVKT